MKGLKSGSKVNDLTLKMPSAPTCTYMTSATVGMCSGSVIW